jgi:signal peptidase II
MRRSKSGIFWGVTGIVLLLDAFTKTVAVDRLIPAHLPRSVWGDGLRLTLVYNPGAAFGLHFGPLSRWIFIGLTCMALLILGRLYLETPLHHRMRTLALALVTGGALGNLLDRLKSGRGVVDFIDIGVGTLRWPTFNVADMAVTTGSILLAWVLWNADDVPASMPAPMTAPMAAPLVPAEGDQSSAGAAN